MTVEEQICTSSNAVSIYDIYLFLIYWNHFHYLLSYLRQLVVYGLRFEISEQCLMANLGMSRKQYKKDGIRVL